MSAPIFVVVSTSTEEVEGATGPEVDVETTVRSASTSFAATKSTIDYCRKECPKDELYVEVWQDDDMIDGYYSNEAVDGFYNSRIYA